MGSKYHEITSIRKESYLRILAVEYVYVRSAADRQRLYPSPSPSPRSRPGSVTKIDSKFIIII